MPERLSFRKSVFEALAQEVPLCSQLSSHQALYHKRHELMKKSFHFKVYLSAAGGVVCVCVCVWCGGD